MPTDFDIENLREIRKCDYCEEITTCQFVVDPYSFEIFGDDTKHWICDNCQIQSAQDI